MRRIFISIKEQKLLYDLTGLQLWYVFYLSLSKIETFERAIFCQTPFYNYLPWHITSPIEKISPEEQPLWKEFVKKIKIIYDKYPSFKMSKDFVNESIKFVFPMVLESEIYQKLNVEEKWFGCFRYTYSKEKKYVALHFKNAYVPKSPFSPENMKKLFASLKDLILDIDKNHYEVEKIGCGSWLNNLPPFQKLFPPSYIASLTPTSPNDKRGNGWWGQFISHKGVLHRKRAKILKTQKIFPYKRLQGECNFSEFREYIFNEIKNGSR